MSGVLSCRMELIYSQILDLIVIIYEKDAAVFARIEPYLRTANVPVPALVASSTSSNENIEQLNTTSNQSILGGNCHKISG